MVPYCANYGANCQFCFLVLSAKTSVIVPLSLLAAVVIVGIVVYVWRYGRAGGERLGNNSNPSVSSF